jgi:hypothetical protein
LATGKEVTSTRNRPDWSRGDSFQIGSHLVILDKSTLVDRPRRGEKPSMQILGPFPDEPDIEAELSRRASDEDRICAFQARLLLELVRHLQAQGSAPRAFGRLFLDDLWLSPVRSVDPIIIKVWADWRDYGPSRDGVPVMHYRMQFRRGKAGLSTDVRAERPEDVEQIVWEAFGWNR